MLLFSEGSRTSPERVTMGAVNFLSKLKPTGGLKPWEKGLPTYLNLYSYPVDGTGSRIMKDLRLKVTYIFFIFHKWITEISCK